MRKGQVILVVVAFLLVWFGLIVAVFYKIRPKTVVVPQETIIYTYVPEEATYIGPNGEIVEEYTGPVYFNEVEEETLTLIDDLWWDIDESVAYDVPDEEYFVITEELEKYYRTKGLYMDSYEPIYTMDSFAILGIDALHVGDINSSEEYQILYSEVLYACQQFCLDTYPDYNLCAYVDSTQTTEHGDLLTIVFKFFNSNMKLQAVYDYSTGKTECEWL